MDYFLVVLFQIVGTVGNLALISVGLAVIFGMMRVINLAHGEFIMLGGFAAIFSVQAGVSVWIAMLVVAPLSVAMLGIVVERLIMRRLYGRMVDTMLASWGLSLLLIGLATTFFGNRVVGIAAPVGSFHIGAYSLGAYDFVLTGVALVVFAGGYALLRFTQAGLIARATMQNREMASSLGIEPSRVYAITFAVGAGLSGLAGGLLAPISGVLPTMGVAYVAKAFITVITGGASVIVGTALSSALLGSINTVSTFLTTPVIGDVALLLAATVFLRLLPTGITGRILKGAP
ncbi:branched-chain amino acid ABC transporter permease (plasmid) [Agrobacterium tumefaciens]|uniref:Branched-chain amino acid ABC transporter permease n=1 Tax=Agrobacterium tumefaciens TaxID=358 RepID=A0AAP9E9V2_AGRTU|nr:branched-chain amino acid ABC transporter permease [Agrobacterium tumefaciens]NSZ60076.1 branched-chain amino acid ABC transporter permease [Agrobacterium tumefaciens]QDY97676.1 branched-chain amino acid ABC transporter permease [Agrobacterium tumefaciens]UXS12799.1 branched-chain amino acid ABC transporter permease [Agrobacterium tumefaciens]UXS20160.1 branched-chain amino acid ABC transporter permease [Agrobacterium tumefaciens]UXS27808.1 branched-chain amino acid ABC transporter permease